MAIQLECYSLIIPIKIVDKHYPGGYEQYKKDKEVLFEKEYYNIFYDDYLIKEGAMSWESMVYTIEQWEKLGVKIYSEEEDNKKFEDVCVAVFPFGPTLPCDWLIHDFEKFSVSFKKKGEQLCTEQ